jgi:hypothetical protein
MSKTLEYLEETIKYQTEKTADELRRQDITNFPLHKYFAKQHKKDTEKGIVRLIDGRIIQVFF